jgi:hypothetical protein
MRGGIAPAVCPGWAYGEGNGARTWSASQIAAQTAAAIRQICHQRIHSSGAGPGSMIRAGIGPVISML